MNVRDVAAKVVEGEAVIIDLASGVYYSLDAPGALVWAMLERHHSEASVAAELASRFGVDEDRAGADVARLISSLQSEGLVVEAADGAPPSEPLDIELPTTEPYEAPTLEKYSDMADLLALDPPMPGIKDIPWERPAG